MATMNMKIETPSIRATANRIGLIDNYIEIKNQIAALQNQASIWQREIFELLGDQPEAWVGDRFLKQKEIHVKEHTRKATSYNKLTVK